MTFFHGIQVNEPVEGVRLPLEKSTAVIGLIATASAEVGATADALDTAFPLDTPVLVTSVRRAIGVAGTGGTLKPALEAIADQGEPLVIVIRVGIETGVVDDPTQEELVLGGTTGGIYTGIQALLVAEARTGIRPRILGAPGLDTQAVANALIVAAKALRGFVYFAARDENGALCATRDDAVTYREEFAEREGMLIWPDWTGWDGYAIATALGKRAALDQAEGWHRSISNSPVTGVTGISKDVTFDIRNQTTDAGVLNQAPVTTLVRMNGYRFWGNRTTSDEPLFAFEVAVRTSQAIQDAIADAEAQFIDRPMTVGLVRDIIEIANAKLALWQAQGRIIGGNCWYDSSLNPVEQLQNGALAIDYDFTSVAPLEGLTLNQRITGKYYLGFAQQLNA